MFDGVREKVEKIFSSRILNLVITSFLVFASIYVTITSLLHRNLVDPLEVKNQTFVEDEVGTLKEDGQNRSDMQDYARTIVSLFILWMVALIFGKMCWFLSLPPLFGMLVAGMCFGNVPWIKNVLFIDRNWETVLRQIAFIFILIRAGIGIDPVILKKSIYTCSLLGFLSTAIEATSIVLAAHFLFNVPVGLGTAFAFILTSTSPAITVPTMIKLQQEERGREKGVPTVILTGATVDNLFCITCFYVVLATVLTASAGKLPWTIVSVILELVVAVVVGCAAGWLLKFFPRKDVKFFHFTRAALILSISLAAYFGSREMECFIAGPVVIFLMCILASMEWKFDNPRGTKSEEKTFRISWIFFFQPILFALIGLLFDFSVITLTLFLHAMAILGIGLCFRIVAVFLITLSTLFNWKEKGFASICFMPKATVQAALAPTLAAYCLSYSEYVQYSNLLLQTCILSIVFTAPLGQMLILWIGRKALPKKARASGERHNPSNGGLVEDNGLAMTKVHVQN